jgi:hypothetical protein
MKKNNNNKNSSNNNKNDNDNIQQRQHELHLGTVYFLCVILVFFIHSLRV